MEKIRFAQQPDQFIVVVLIFFVGFAQWACGHMTDETARLWAATAPYAPLKHRVNGVVVNLPEFAEAFHCKAGDAMVKPAGEVCRIW